MHGSCTLKWQLHLDMGFFTCLSSEMEHKAVPNTKVNVFMFSEEGTE